MGFKPQHCCGILSPSSLIIRLTTIYLCRIFGRICRWNTSTRPVNSSRFPFIVRKSFLFLIILDQKIKRVISPGWRANLGNLIFHLIFLSDKAYHRATFWEKTRSMESFIANSFLKKFLCGKVWNISLKNKFHQTLCYDNASFFYWNFLMSNCCQKNEKKHNNAHTHNHTHTQWRQIIELNQHK